jgi:hypothetical protein
MGVLAMSAGARARGCVLALLLATLAASGARADGPALQAQYQTLESALASSPFQRPLVLQSVETPNALKGDVFAVVDYPFSAVSAALQPIQNWCDILILHLNVKQCHAISSAAKPTLAVRIGRKSEQAPDDAYAVEFVYESDAATADYLQVVLHADTGPMGTRDYRILLEAVPLSGDRAFLHFGYTYTYGFTARLAMQGYLNTLGRDKVGFTVVGPSTDDPPQYVDGVRGVVERNTMRYYLAIDAYLNSLSLAPDAQIEQRLRLWFAATERYARQLHELDEGDYLAMKHASCVSRSRASSRASADDSALTRLAATAGASRLPPAAQTKRVGQAYSCGLHHDHERSHRYSPPAFLLALLAPRHVEFRPAQISRVRRLCRHHAALGHALAEIHVEHGPGRAARLAAATIHSQRLEQRFHRPSQTPSPLPAGAAHCEYAFRAACLARLTPVAPFGALSALRRAGARLARGAGFEL